MVLHSHHEVPSDRRTGNEDSSQVRLWVICFDQVTSIIIVTLGNLQNDGFPLTRGSADGST